MKICVLQPKYSFHEADAANCFEGLLSLLDQCDKSMDLIVLPEYSDVLADVKGKAGYYTTVNQYHDALLKKAKDTAKRCSSLLFVNAGDKSELGIRNTTYAIDRNGNIIGRYFKEHPAPGEVKTDAEGGHELDVQYSYEYHSPYILEIEGLRFGFLTCYDFYFYENYARIARENVDIIIGCSLQRTDTHEALSIINRFLCYQTNAYLVRSSVSLGASSTVCGCSMVVSPKGEELVNLKSQVGLGVCEIDPNEKYYKAAGHQGKLKAHYEYIEEGRRPWLYRNGGASVVPFDSVMKYPRICAVHGFHAAAPKSSMPAFGAAVALGAEEIAFELFSTKDRVLVSCHDNDLNQVSNGTGSIDEHTYQELLELDFGAIYGDAFRGLKIPTFEEILQKFAGRVIMNLHIKPWNLENSDWMVEEIVGMIRKYDAQKHVYFTSSNDKILKEVKRLAPEMAICLDCSESDSPEQIMARAGALGAQKVQLYPPHVNPQSIALAHRNGLVCNAFCADETGEAIACRTMGVDCILTNDYLATKNILNEQSGRTL